MNYKGYIYIIQNKFTEKTYVGSTIDFVRRVRQHICKTRYNDKFHKELSKNPDKFNYLVIEVVESDDYDDFSFRMYLAELKWWAYYKFNYSVYNKYKPGRVGQRFTTFDEDRIEKHRECHEGKEHKSIPNVKKLNEIKNIFNNIG